MKTLILVVTASLAAATPVASAATANNCPQILANLKTDASAIAQNANSYWKHRANFVDISYGSGRQVNKNARAVAAEQEKNYGNALKAALPKSLKSFNDQVTSAQSQNCLSFSQLSSTFEQSNKLAKRIKFDKFPEDEDVSTESSINPGSPRMPIH